MNLLKKYKHIIIINILLITCVYLIIYDYNYIYYSITESNYIDNDINNNDYIGIISIPKINLKKGLVDINSKNNNVKYNIEILNNSTMPDKDISNLFLASHSGNGKNAYFNKLYELDINDYIYFYYNDIKYTYIVSDIYKVDKIGKINIGRNNNNKMITLITCDQVDKTKQIVLIAKIL